MRFLEARGRDAHELAALLELGDRAGAHVEHRLAQPADELVGDGEKVSVDFRTDVSENLIKVTLTAECIEQIGKIQELP